MPLLAEMRERMKHKNGHAHHSHAHHIPDMSRIADKVPSWDEISERLPMLERVREDLPDWDDVRDRITTPPATTGVAYSLLGTGVGLGAFMVYTRRSSFLAWLFPALLLAGGLALLTGGFAHRRGARIDETIARVRAELSTLGPLGRARVVSSMANENIAPLIRRIHQQ